MSKTQPPLSKARHLRLVPPLPPLVGDGDGPGPRDGPVAPPLGTGQRLGGGPRAISEAAADVSSTPWDAALPMGQTPPWLKWGSGAAAGLLVLWAMGGTGSWPWPTVHPAMGLHALRGGKKTAHLPSGPSFQLYAKAQDSVALGRPLHDGDALFADDHLILGIHNALSPGTEAAQFAAVFAMDHERHIAALYPALGPDAVAMPLPQVASMALMDGPQLSGDPGPVTLVAVFLRRQVSLGALMDGLRDAAEGAGATPQLHTLHAEGLMDAVVRLQSITLTHSRISVGAP